MTAIAVPQNKTQTGSGLLKLTLTELKLLTRERVRVALPVAIPLILIIILGNISSLRQPGSGRSGWSAAGAGRPFRGSPPSSIGMLVSASRAKPNTTMIVVYRSMKLSPP